MAIIKVERLWIDFRLKLDIPCPECGGELHIGTLFIQIGGVAIRIAQFVFCDDCNCWLHESHAPDGAFVENGDYGGQEWVCSILECPYIVETGA